MANSGDGVLIAWPARSKEYPLPLVKYPCPQMYSSNSRALYLYTSQINPKDINWNWMLWKEPGNADVNIKLLYAELAQGSKC